MHKTWYNACGFWLRRNAKIWFHKTLKIMRHLLFFILIICVSANYSKAQEKIEVLYEKDTAGKYIFYCTNENYCSCFLFGIKNANN